jgi:hypothetical protein
MHTHRPELGTHGLPSLAAEPSGPGLCDGEGCGEGGDTLSIADAGGSVLEADPVEERMWRIGIIIDINIELGKFSKLSDAGGRKAGDVAHTRPIHPAYAGGEVHLLLERQGCDERAGFC